MMMVMTGRTKKNFVQSFFEALEGKEEKDIYTLDTGHWNSGDNDEGYYSYIT